jgi:predicted transcriptional regulator
MWHGVRPASQPFEITVVCCNDSHNILNIIHKMVNISSGEPTMAFDLTQALFQSRTRTALLRVLFEGGVSDSMSGLARRVKLSSHAVAVEVRNLAKAGLVTVESVGASDLVRANTEHPVVKPLLELLRTAASFAKVPADDSSVMESLVAYGAPLLAYKPRRHLPLEEALIQGLRAAKRDGTLLKVLPVVVAKNAQVLDWAALKENAKREKLRAELGMLVDLTADVAQMPELKERVRDLEDRRRTVTSFFCEPRSKYERELAKSVTPAAARKWHFLMNLGEDTLRSALRKHLG